ncbi:Stk1 family PASTA domain-containing Ser/Thr kinase [Spongiactinospora sp. TRM90649]|uniref:Stk1 family PASTA domain-containing Ser/Thr kinase n=1 Tax=Spongiactinospora sp. TRM90649 TaxID=3031114 RepID=UPI0023F73418|nr:Stk1 family PASTA domain-containing Ser/Thr kinase [Spongiactinospora sp. TRM90649]MDF5751570.1 PASTA domain-containing protein [Spongiactinospora sp. TRM90649]
MSIEDALKDAMSGHVGDVRADPATGAAIRRRHRRRVVGLRTAGAALVTAVVAGSVPVYLAVNAGPERGGDVASGATSTAGATVAPGAVVPDLARMTSEQADQALKAAGLRGRFYDVPSSDVPGGSVVSQAPPPGAPAEPGSDVRVNVANGTKDKLPSEMGDLGDGGTRFAGVDWKYLPGGLKWANWFVEDTFGVNSAATSWSFSGRSDGTYGIEVVVYRGGAVADIRKRMDGYRDQGAEPIKIRDGKRAFLVSVGEAVGELVPPTDKVTMTSTFDPTSEPEPSGTPKDPEALEEELKFDEANKQGKPAPNEGEPMSSTRTLVWVESSGLAVEIMASPDFAAKVDVDAELKKIAEAAVVLD